MSHLHERKEKVCLNCKANLQGRYCHNCGQENVEPKESVWHLFVHFFNDITHFDGKFFSTIRLLITKPGFLSEEYMNGRRAAYLNPIRMYLFVSFFFFLLQFSLPSHDDTRTLKVQRTLPERSTKQDTVKQDNRTVADTLAKGIYSEAPGEVTIDDSAWFNKAANTFSTVAAYDSAQRALPRSERHNLAQRFAARRVIAFQEYADANPDDWKQDYLDILTHSIPKMLFVSIPLFAFILYLLHVRRRKVYYFVSHGIFALHVYCTIYLLLILLLPLAYLNFAAASWAYSILLLVVPAAYLFLAMKRFYKQGFFKTFIKFVLLLSTSSILFAVLLLLFLFNALIVLTNGVH